jgi:hypothetical protein
MLDSSGGDPRVARRFSLRNKKWKYRGEGNANLVLALPQVGFFLLHSDPAVPDIRTVTSSAQYWSRYISASGIRCVAIFLL